MVEVQANLFHIAQANQRAGDAEQACLEADRRASQMEQQMEEAAARSNAELAAADSRWKLIHLILDLDCYAFRIDLLDNPSSDGILCAQRQTFDLPGPDVHSG